MQVRPGDAAGGADLADLLPGTHHGTSLYADGAHVAVHGDQSAAVIEDHGVAVEEEVARVNHPAGAGSMDRCARVGGDVHAAVGVARFVVEYAP